MNIATAPTTNIRILAGVALAVVFVLGNMLAGLFGKVIALEVNIMVGTFILIQEGLDVTQWAIKRKTFDPDAYAEGVVRESVSPPPVAPGAASVPPAEPVVAAPVYERQNDDRELPMRAAPRADGVLVRDD
jgi:hypothetical protein